MENSSFLDLIGKYFTGFSEKQVRQFEQLFPLYEEWNAKINVISRKDMQQFYLHHVLHSLAIAKIAAFQPGTKIIDIGTGGGFPGIPLAILFPDSDFHLVDSIRKKITVVQAVIDALELKNASAEWARVEDVHMKFHFAVSRAVTELSTLVQWCKPKIMAEQFNNTPNGLFSLKGGDLTDEIKKLKENFPRCIVRNFAIQDFFEEEYFREKHVVHVFF